MTLFRLFLAQTFAYWAMNLLHPGEAGRAQLALAVIKISDSVRP